MDNETEYKGTTMDEKMTMVLNSVESLKEEMSLVKKVVEDSEKRIGERITKELNSLKEKMSLMEDKVAFYGYQAKGEGTPKEVRRVPGGYGLLEPRSTWRRERYGR
jgi:hypothetical protein